MAAMQQFQPDSASEADLEYRAIEATLLESARGRWFLAEHGRRARRLDSALLEDAIGKLQNSIRQPPALLGQLQAEVEGIRAKIEKARGELLERPASAGGDSAETSGEAAGDAALEGSPSEGTPSEGSPAGADSDWQPMDKMLAAAEEIHEQAWALQAKDINPEACEAIARQASSLYALSMHQAVHSTRILKLADALDATSANIGGILQTIAHELQIDTDGADTLDAGAAGAADTPLDEVLPLDAALAEPGSGEPGSGEPGSGEPCSVEASSEPEAGEPASEAVETAWADSVVEAPASESDEEDTSL